MFRAIFIILTFLPRMIFKGIAFLFKRTKLYMAIRAFRGVMSAYVELGINVYIFTDEQVEEYIKDEFYVSNVKPVHMVEIEIEDIQETLKQGKSIEELERCVDNVKNRKKNSNIKLAK
jgi:hypothetical protein